MIVQNGQIKMLNQQLAYLATLQWCLFTTNLTPAPTDVAATYTAAEAAWAGYSRQTVGSWPTPTTTSGYASTSPPTLLSFPNTSGSAQAFYGWFAIDPADGSLVAAFNTGLQSVVSGIPYTFSPAVTDQNTGP